MLCFCKERLLIGRGGVCKELTGKSELLSFQFVEYEQEVTAFRVPGIPKMTRFSL
jgi:hypothetical protein